MAYKKYNVVCRDAIVYVSEAWACFFFARLFLYKYGYEPQRKRNVEKKKEKAEKKGAPTIFPYSTAVPRD